jgi:uncharacterized protein YndB with AHSA1/START domain
MKEKLELEYSVNVSPNILFSRLSTPGGLAEWFADDIYVQDDIFKFKWTNAEQQARLLHHKKNRCIRFKWTDDDDGESYFEFRIARDELTGDVALIITDFADGGEKEDIIELWDTQISNLKLALGVS